LLFKQLVLVATPVSTGVNLFNRFHSNKLALIANHGVSDETYKKAAQLFDEAFIAQIIMAVATINAWSRIAISTKMGFGIKPASLTAKAGITEIQTN